jgi:hypothetical protein
VPRRNFRIVASIALLASAALTVQASDFWISKDWKQWSKGECEGLLLESPWAHLWRYQTQPAGLGLPNTMTDQLHFSVQLRSALPIREAIVRQLELDQKYDKMNASQRSAFDAKATPILSRSYDDLILVHVDFSQSDGTKFLQAAIHNQVAAGDQDPELVSEDGTQVKPIRVDVNEKAPYAFDLIFPRMKDGAPLIKEGQKQFSVQFQSPPVNYFEGMHIASRRVRIDYDLSKMLVNGKPSY